MDSESLLSLTQMADQKSVLENRFSDVKSVLVIFSAKGIVFDREALLQKIHAAYPSAAVFFGTTALKPVGADSPKVVDLLIDFTGPGQRQGWFAARTLRRKARFAVGRNAGLFRKRLYDRIFDEKAPASEAPSEILQRERFVQRKVLALAGVAFAPVSDALEDLSRSIALDLPSMKSLK
jgi:hypothetical protein